MIENLKKNCVGTSDFTGKFKGMMKAQSFTIYPIPAGEPATHITIQSDTRMGYINLVTGVVIMSRPHANGAYQVHLDLEGRPIDALVEGELTYLKEFIRQTASPHAGSNGMVYTDNAGASQI